MDFEIAIDSTFLELYAESSLEPVGNKRVLSILNNFEDGTWRLNHFQDFVWNNVAETALSYRERQALGSMPQSMLRLAAQNLRLTDADKNDIGRGSELAEIVLYAIMKHRYGAIPVVPKIFYKQNSQDNAKGSDSVHIVLTADGNDFSLWLGEAKFYNSIEDARLHAIVETVKASLSTDKLKKENSIVTSVSDLDDVDIPPKTKQAIRDALSQNKSIDDLKPRLHVPILLLHECAITANTTEWSAQYVESVKQFHLDRALAYFSTQIAHLNAIHKYAEIHFHLNPVSSAREEGDHRQVSQIG